MHGGDHMCEGSVDASATHVWRTITHDSSAKTAFFKCLKWVYSC